MVKKFEASGSKKGITYDRRAEDTRGDARGDTRGFKGIVGGVDPEKACHQLVLELAVLVGEHFNERDELSELRSQVLKAIVGSGYLADLAAHPAMTEYPTTMQHLLMAHSADDVPMQPPEEDASQEAAEETPRQRMRLHCKQPASPEQMTPEQNKIPARENTHKRTNTEEMQPKKEHSEEREKADGPLQMPTGVSGGT